MESTNGSNQEGTPGVSWEKRACCRHALRMRQHDAGSREPYFRCPKDGKVEFDSVEALMGVSLDVGPRSFHDDMEVPADPVADAEFFANDVRAAHVIDGNAGRSARSISSYDVVDAFALNFYLGSAVREILIAAASPEDTSRLRQAIVLLEREAARRGG